MWRAALLSICIAGPASGEDWATVSHIFETHCTMCHSGEFAPLGLSLDSHEAALAGSENGPVLVPGDVEGSALYRRLTGAEEPRMPLTGPPFLEESQIAAVSAWIEAGLPGGDVAVPEVDEPQRPEGQVWFQDVEGIFLQRCAKCHSDGSIMGAPPEGLRLSSLDRILAGGERAVVVPGNAGMSLVWRHVAGIERPRMPLDGPPYLSDDEIERIEAWIDGGARDETGEPATVPVGRRVRVEGVLTAPGELDGGRFTLAPGARVEDPAVVGGTYELRGGVAPDGSVSVERFRER